MRFEGKTVDIAIAQACIKLEKTAKELDIKVIREESKGFLGLGSKTAIIEVELKENKKQEVLKENSEIEKKVVLEENSEIIKEKELVKKNDKFDIIDDVIEFLDNYFNKINVKSSYDYDIDDLTKDVNINIITDKPNLVIGKRGTLLDALQVIVNNIFSKKRCGYWIKFNCDEYREKRKKTIESLAIRTAKNVKKYKKKMYLENLNSSERKIIHSVLQNDEKIETYSEGKEPNRRLVIAIKR